MLQYYNNGTTEKASLEPVFNYFWNIPNINVYITTVSDRMHHLDLGLYRYQIEFIKKLLFEIEGRSLVDKMNWRITLIPRHPELKIFSGGLQSIALLITDNYRNIMKVIVFVVDDLLNKDLSELHLWVYHIVNTIREFRAINEYTTETYKALYKIYVKIPYRLSNKKDVEEQMMKTIQRKAIIKQNDFEKKFKTPLKFNYSLKLFEFDISEAFEFIDKYKNETNLDEKMIKGLDHFIQSLDSYFDLLKISTAQGCHIKIYESVTLENRAILRTKNMFHKWPWFSNISLHLWVYHIVNTIREFRAINEYTTETYKALYKIYVKIPYRLSNKKDVEEQMMKTIQRKAIIKQNDFEKKFKTPLKFNYSLKLFEFDISEAFEFIDKYKNETNLDEKMIKGLDHFIQSLDSYFDLLKISTAQGCHIKIYESVTLENRAILRTKNMFHKWPWFSNISVTMNDKELFEYQSDNGICYAQTLLITEVFLKKEKLLHLALVQWYDFISKRTPFIYGCPLLKLMEVYNFIKIEAIEDIVHIVPRFDKTNEYLQLDNNYLIEGYNNKEF
ncbi:hypothetical protein Glove_284g14 [Diversispora epigaea]|uniref:Uncharacterized protein n=1 Tax=Diversispora epigaea TaxID=1348612 RepID=A0A397I171_9GLOM|nr:hypothetical protein Glove_284g14 [Diversispora epigaea]